MTDEHRTNLLQRTEEKVISLANKTVIDGSSRIRYAEGKAISARWNGTELIVDINYAGQRDYSLAVDCLVNAFGFGRWNLLRLVEHEFVRPLLGENPEAYRTLAENGLNPDLSLPTICGAPAGLHVPALASMAQGPGMANLGSLGLMARRILDGYVT